MTRRPSSRPAVPLAAHPRPSPLALRTVVSRARRRRHRAPRPRSAVGGRRATSTRRCGSTRWRSCRRKAPDRSASTATTRRSPTSRLASRSAPTADRRGRARPRWPSSPPRPIRRSSRTSRSWSTTPTTRSTASSIRRKYFVPYFNVAGSVFGGLRGAARRSGRAGAAQGGAGAPEASTPASAPRRRRSPSSPRAETRSRMSAAGPAVPGRRPQVERGLADSAAFVDGIPALFDKYRLKGYEEAFAQAEGAARRLRRRSCARTILPKARTDFRLPPELYASQPAPVRRRHPGRRS